MSWTLDQYFQARAQLDIIYREDLLRQGEYPVLTDPGGYVNWVYHMRENGMSIEEVRAIIRQSTEYKMKHPDSTEPP